MFSPAARKLLPLASECKNCEKLNIWEAYDQAKGHAESTPYEPVVWFGKNGRNPLVCLDADAFLALLASGIEHDPMGDDGDTE